MTNTMTYKGYAARIEYDDEDGIFTGRIAGIRDGVGFHADTVEGLRERNVGNLWPCHCTGTRAIEALAAAFGERSRPCGCGTVIAL